MWGQVVFGVLMFLLATREAAYVSDAKFATRLKRIVTYPIVPLLFVFIYIVVDNANKLR